MTAPAAESASILHTKLNRPRLTPGLIERGRLLDRFRRAMERPIILISAPAGYGKTTMVNLWLESLDQPYAWLSLDEQDSNLSGFITYLVAAICTAYPQAVGNVSAALVGPSKAQPAVLAELLLRDLEALAEPLVLVLDDYHVIHDLNVHTFMARVVQRLPAGIHLMLTSRSDPPIGLARLRGRGLLAEFRGTDLRFTRDEAMALMQHLLHEPLDDKIVDVVVERTEGWPASLQLISVALRDSEDRVGFAHRFAQSNHRTVMDYLLNEVLAEATEDQRALLLYTSILERFCAPLCDTLAKGTAVYGQSQQLIDRAWQSNLFLVALDAEGVWYRYHHLFRDLLRHRLQRTVAEETIAGLHRRASAWFEKNGLLEEAIVHAISAGDADQAARLVEANINNVLNREDWRLLEHWLGLLPQPLLQRPALLIAQAFVQWFRYNLGSIDRLLEAGVAGLAENTAGYSAEEIVQIGAHVHQLKSNVFLGGSAEQRLYHAEKALQNLDARARFARSQTEMFYAAALHQIGRTDEGLAYLSTELHQQITQPDSRTFRLIIGMLNIHYAEADLTSIETMAETLLQMAQAQARLLTSGWALFALGWVCYQRYELDSAAQYFSQAIDMRYAISARAAVDCFVGLALIQQTRGQSDAAVRTAAGLREYLVDLGLFNLAASANALDLRLALDREMQDSARRRWQVPAELTVQPEGQLAADVMVPPVFTAIRAYMAHGTPESLGSAWSLLQQCRAYAEHTHSRRRLIEIGAAEALYHTARGDEATARKVLCTAVRLAEPGGALRLILDAGPGLRPYLQLLRDQGIAPDYLTRMLTVGVQDTGAVAPLISDPAVSQLPLAAPSSASPDIVEDLTTREQEVLVLLAQGLSNKEIAEALIISPNTVKKHTINLYGKLQVPNRRRAVRVARALGYLPQNQ